MTQNSRVYCPECDGMAHAGQGEDREWCNACNGSGFRQVCERCPDFDFAHGPNGCGASHKRGASISRCKCPALV